MRKEPLTVIFPAARTETRHTVKNKNTTSFFILETTDYGKAVVHKTGHRTHHIFERYITFEYSWIIPIISLFETGLPLANHSRRQLKAPAFWK